jgi:hypothetical protein
MMNSSIKEISLLYVERSNSDDRQANQSITFVAYKRNVEDNNRYVVKLIDLEKLNNLSEFIVSRRLTILFMS